MIKYREGDVVAAFKNNEVDILVHGVNCQGKMNSGIAKQIRAEFPEVFENYEFYVRYHTRSCSNCEGCCVCGSDNNKKSKLLGDIQNVRIGNSFKFIVNAFTQDKYGYNGNQFVSYDAINEAMKSLKDQISDPNVVVAMPKIGSKLGGGDWNVIEAIINSVFHDRDVFVYEFDSGS